MHVIKLHATVMNMSSGKRVLPREDSTPVDCSDLC